MFAIKSESIHSLELTGSALFLCAAFVQVNALTFFCGKHCDDAAERALAQAVVHAHFHFELGQGCHAVVSVNVPRRIRRRQHRLDPGAAAKWAESHDVAKVLSALLFLWNWLRSGQESYAFDPNDYERKFNEGVVKKVK